MTTFPVGQVTPGEFDMYMWKSISDHPKKFPKKYKKGSSVGQVPPKLGQISPFGQVTPGRGNLAIGGFWIFLGIKEVKLIVLTFPI